MVPRDGWRRWLLLLLLVVMVWHLVVRRRLLALGSESRVAGSRKYRREGRRGRLLLLLLLRHLCLRRRAIVPGARPEKKASLMMTNHDTPSTSKTLGESRAFQRERAIRATEPSSHRVANHKRQRPKEKSSRFVLVGVRCRRSG